MEKYNLSMIGGSQDGLEFLTNTSTLLGGFVTGYIIMIMTFGVFFLHLMSKGFGIKECFSGASWVLMITSLLLRAMGLIGDYALYIGIAFVPLSIMLAYFDSDA